MAGGVTYYDDKASLRAAARRGQYKTNKPIGPPKKKVKQKYVKPVDTGLPKRYQSDFKPKDYDNSAHRKLCELIKR